jgi:hypothetical protein
MKQYSKYMLLITVSGIFATSAFAQVTEPVTTPPQVTAPVAPQVSSTGEVKTEAEGKGKHKKQKEERKAKEHGKHGPAERADAAAPATPQVSSAGEVETKAEGKGKHKKQKGERKAKKHGLDRADEVAGEHGKAGRDNARAKQNREQD